MSVETDIAKLQERLDHLEEQLNKVLSAVERLTELFNMGKGISMFIVKFCVTVGAIATSIVFISKELWPFVK